MGRGKRGGAAACFDGSIPFDFLLGERYSGYRQAINASRDLKPMPSKLPKLFWGLSNEQRRLLAARILEAGYSGDGLERAIRLAIWGEVSSRRSVRVPSRVQPLDTARNGIGLDGRPIVPERFRPREPFLVLEAEEAQLLASKARVEKPHERADCGPARRRREIQEKMRARVQVQEDFLTGLELDRREWRRHHIEAVKHGAVAAQRRRRRARFTYGSNQGDSVGGDLTSGHHESDQARREKQEVSLALKAARQAKLKANADSAEMRRWEKEVLKTIRALAAGSSIPTTPGSSFGRGSAGDDGVRRSDISHALRRWRPPSAEKHVGGNAHYRAPDSSPAGKGESAADGQGQQATRAGLVGWGGSPRPARQPDEAAAGALCGGSADGGRGAPQQSLQNTVVGVGAGDGRAASSREQGPPPEQSGRDAITVGRTAEGLEPTGVEAAGGYGFGGAGGISEISDDGDRAGGEGQENGVIKSIVERLLRTSSSVARAVARPLSVKSPLVLEVEKDPNQAELTSQIRSRHRKRFPHLQRAFSERTFVGGGYKIGGGGGGGRNADAKESGGNASGGKSLELAPSPRSSSCLALTSATVGFLDLEAVSAAAGRLHGGGGRGCLSAETVPRQPPRNRFAPMVQSELESFFLQAWSNRCVATNMRGADSGDPAGRGGVAVGGRGTGILCPNVGGAPKTSVLTPIRGRQHLAGGVRGQEAGLASTVVEAPAPPDFHQLEGWTSSHSPRSGSG